MGRTGHQCDATVTFNNQDSILMTMYLQATGILCFLHDNRIYAFKKHYSYGNMPVSAVEEQTLLLTILTTAKFRAMGFLYCSYHLVDNVMFIIIIVMSLKNSEFGIPENHLVSALFGMFGLETFCDIMLYTHRYWILQRLSVYIAFVLYFIYVAIIALFPEELFIDITRGDVFRVLGIRFIAFVLETLVDIMMDIELHNDLVKLEKLRLQNQDQKGAWNNPQQTSNEKHWLSKYVDVSNSVSMSRDMEYMGSTFAWGMASVFDGCERKEPFPQVYSYALCLLPIIPAAIVFLSISALCLAAGLLIVILELTTRIVTGRVNPVVSVNYWKELLHF